MTPLINKTKEAISGAVLFVASIAMAGLGFAVLALLAFFALLAIGIAVLAAPFATVANEEKNAVANAKVVA